MNYTGCGNSLNFDSPAGHPAGDGLAALLGRGHARGRVPLRPRLGPRPRRAAGIVPVVRPRSSTPSRRIRCSTGSIMIAEPWDIGTYQVGNFPVDWSEWNGKFRDTVRRFGKGDAGPAGRRRLASDRIGRSLRRRRPLGLQQHQLHHLPRRFHAARSGLLQRQAQRGERREQSATGPTTTTRGTAARKATPTTPPCWRCASS